MTQRLRHFRRTWSLLVLIVLSACAAKTPPNLDPQAQLEFTADQVVKLVNDVTTSAIAANRAGKLSDDLERQVLTVNKQVLDVIAANPTIWKTLAQATFANAVQALPRATQIAIDPYLQQVSAILARIP